MKKILVLVLAIYIFCGWTAQDKKNLENCDIFGAEDWRQCVLRLAEKVNSLEKRIAAMEIADDYEKLANNDLDVVYKGEL